MSAADGLMSKICPNESEGGKGEVSGSGETTGSSIGSMVTG